MRLRRRPGARRGDVAGLVRGENSTALEMSTGSIQGMGSAFTLGTGATSARVISPMVGQEQV